MPKSPSDRQPEPMAREVDRLLAQLTHYGSQPAHEPGPPGGTPPPPRASQTRSSAAAPLTVAPTRRDLLALWARGVLGVALGGLMTQWPYPHDCGLPLLAYLGAVFAVMLSAAWIAFASWKLDSGAAHILSLILFYWGIVLAAEQLLPRIGYAAEEASWRCSVSRTAAAPSTPR